MIYPPVPFSRAEGALKRNRDFRSVSEAESDEGAEGRLKKGAPSSLWLWCCLSTAIPNIYQGAPLSDRHAKSIVEIAFTCPTLTYRV